MDVMTGVWVVFITAAWVGTAYLSGKIAESRQHSFVAFFLFGLFLPILTLIFALFLSDRTEPREHQT